MTEVVFTFEGHPVSAKPGQSLAAALTGAGILALRETRRGGPRGVFCGMGVCQECLVTIAGEGLKRACMTPVRDGAAIARARFPGETDEAATGQPPITHDDLPVERPDVLVIGGGAGGLSAATAAARAGLDVLLVDERKVAGGQYYKQAADALDLAPLDTQQREGAALVEAATAAGVRRLPAEVWGAFAPDHLLATGPSGTLRLSPRALILATGAYERGVPIPGWTLPGVMTTGAAQTLWRSYRTLPGKRVVIAGNGPLNLQVACELADAGAKVVAVAEASEGPGLARFAASLKLLAADPGLAFTGLGHLAALRRRRVPLRWGATLIRVEATRKGLHVVLGRRDGERVRAPLEAEVDAVCLGYGFEPANEIARALGAAHAFDARRGHLVCTRTTEMETTVANVFAIGDGCGLGGAPAAREEGIIAGLAVARRLGREPSPTLASDGEAAAARLIKHRRFQMALWELFAAPRLGFEVAEPDTLICRCEEVTRAEIDAALADGTPSLGEIKRRTRCGMGRCQGRYCGPLLVQHLATTQGRPVDDVAGFAPRMPVKPVPIADLVKGRVP